MSQAKGSTQTRKRVRKPSAQAAAGPAKKRARAKKVATDPTTSAADAPVAAASGGTAGGSALLPPKTKNSVSYTTEIRDMMYTFGDARNANEETISLVETIVLHYLLDLIRHATRRAHRRGVTRVTLNDLVYQTRKDPAKLDRLKDFLGWKEVRKNFGKSDSPQDKEKPEVLLETPRKKSRRDLNVNFDLLQSLKDMESEEEESGNEDNSVELDTFNKDRLKMADEMTRSMTREEYMEYTECRQASFTYKKNKKFRQWLGAVMNVQLNEDMVEVLGYLAWEMVGSITRQALLVKKQMEASMYRGAIARGGSIINIKLQPQAGEKDNEKTALLPGHIREAIRRETPRAQSLIDFTFSTHPSHHL